jgi:hypothetical protein
LPCISVVWSTAGKLNYGIYFILIFGCNGHLN